MKKIILPCLLVFFATTLFGQWINNPAINNQVANTTINEMESVAVSDGAGGSIIIFSNNPNTNDDLFAQKITAAGVIAWGSIANPVVICNDQASEAYDYKATSDGSGGAYIAWIDYRENSTFGKVYLQHINAAGAVLWLANGIKVASVLVRDDYMPNLCSDGNGGVIIGWTGDDLVTNVQQYAQRFNSAGIPQWTPNGVQVCTAPGFRGGATLLPDNNNGAMVFFTDTRNDANGLNYDSLLANDVTNLDIYGQRLNGSGSRLWTNNGVAICTATGNQDGFESIHVVTDGADGAIVAFLDGRNDPMNNYQNIDLFAQRVNGNGVVQWTSNGVPVSTAPGNQEVVDKCMVPDGSGGMVSTWGDEDSERVYVQRINATGTAVWAVNGIAISPSGFGNWAYDPVLVIDGLGNYIVTFWINYPTFNSGILAQKLNGLGATQWTAGGVPIADIAESRNIFSNEPQATVSDNGSVIVSWRARGVGAMATPNIYASKLLNTGVLDGVNAGYITIADGNWNNSAIWMGGQVPSPGISAIVRHNITVTENAICYSLKVEQPGGTVTIRAGKNLTIQH